MIKKEKETSSQREIYLVDIGNDNGEVKGGTYLGKEDIFFAEENKNTEGKEGKYVEEESILFVGEKNTENKKKGNIWRRKIYAFSGGEEKRGK